MDGVVVGLFSILTIIFPDLEFPEHEAMSLLYRAPRMPRCTTHILICLVYHTHNGGNYACSNYIIETLDSVLKRQPSAGTIHLGDFNKLDDRSLLSFPLRQLVKALTRGLSILDKIYSNIQNYYHKPSVLPCVGHSDHNAESFVPTGNQHSNSGHSYYTFARNNSAIGRAPSANRLASYNWTPFYHLTSCDKLVNSFYDLSLYLLDGL